MKLAFHFNRLNNAKWFAPLIHEAQSKGHEVECWLDYRDISQTTKWFEFPDEEKIKHFLGNKIIYRKYNSAAELNDLLVQLKNQIFITLKAPALKKPDGQIWAHITPVLFDTPLTHSPEELLQYDLIFCQTPYWIDSFIQYYQMLGKLSPQSSLEAEVRKRVVFSGSPKFDQFSLCDKAATKKSLGLSADDKIVSIYMFETTISFWSQQIFHIHSRMKRFINWLILPLSYELFLSKKSLKKLPKIFLRSLVDRVIFLKEIFTCPSEYELLLAARDFCNRNGYKLLFKFRKKNPPKAFHHGIADIEILEDQDYYPYTSAQIVNASDLVVTFFSSTVEECAFAGAPSINLMATEHNYYLRGHYDPLYSSHAEHMEKAHSLLQMDIRPNSIFNFPSVVWLKKPLEFLREMKKNNLENYQMNDASRTLYVKKFLNSSSAPPSSQIISALEVYASDHHKPREATPPL